MSTAGILIIGNEILTAKVQDENAPYLLAELRQAGVDVKRVHVIPDEIDLIADEVRSFSQRFTYVITTGGVGPTHDDVTMDGVAKAFGQKLVRHPAMEEMLLKTLRGQLPNASHLKMCELPEEAELLISADIWFPLVKVRNVFVFPGIPRLLQLKFAAHRGEFQGERVHLRQLYLTAMESDIAHHLNELIAEFPELLVGSYPKIGQPDYRTLVTVESRDRLYLERAVAVLIARIPADRLLRVE
jgi:molybdenum cofactor synthesis domain-containing protein